MVDIDEDEVEVQMIDRYVIVGNIIEFDEIEVMVQIDDKLFIFIKNEHQNRFLWMVELDENDDVEDIIAVLIAHGIELIDVIEQMVQIDGNVFIK